MLSLRQLGICTTMNLRQTQRAVADVVAKCQDAHIQLPVDPFDGMLSATEALRHSRVGGRIHVEDAVEELKQRYGLEPKWQQIADVSEAKRHSRQSRKRLRRGDQDVGSKSKVATYDQRPSGPESSNDPETTDYQQRKKLKPTSRAAHGSSTIDHIIANNPAKNPSNEELAEEFVELGGYEITHGERQKGISRMAVAKQIRQAKEPIKSGEQARDLPHVGPDAAAKIDEVLSRGKMTALEAYEEEKRRETSSPAPPKAIHNADDEDDEDQEESEDKEDDDEWREEDGSEGGDE